MNGPTEGESVGPFGQQSRWGAGCLKTEYSNSVAENQKKVSKTQKNFLQKNPQGGSNLMVWQ